MKLKRMLERVEGFLNAEERQRRARRADMKKVLAKLKKKEKDLRSKLKELDKDEDRDALEMRLQVVHAQRSKGVTALKALKKKRTAAPAPTEAAAPGTGGDRPPPT